MNRVLVIVLAVILVTASVAAARRDRMAHSSGAAKSAVLREWRGVYGGMRTPAEKVIRTQAEWAALWKKLHATQIPPPAAPKVDFAKEMVLAVFMGERPTGGHAITIDRVELGAKEIRVTVRE